jgi:HEAT repeat protein
VLLEALKDADDLKRMRAATVLGAIRSPYTVLPLIEALLDTNPWVWTSAAFVLREIGSPEAVRALAETLRKSLEVPADFLESQSV